MSMEMKHSGIEWIGEIPKEWKVMSIKHYCKSIFAGGTPQSNNSDYWDGDIPWIPSGSCKNCIISSAPKYITQLGLENSSTKLIPSGTTVMAMTGATCSNVGFVTFDTCMNQSVVAYIEDKEKSFSKYLFYLLQGAQEEILTHKTGGAQSGINAEDCKNIMVPFICITKQQKIANYLDKVCGEVDEMIALQEQMIEELKTYKQSVITEAVTKGLNPDVPMKDSGIDWIGEVPEHWKLEPLKYCFGRRSEKNNPVKTKERLSLSIDKGVTLYAEKTTNLDRFKDDFTQYQLAYPNDIVLNCMNMIVGAVGLSKYMGCVSPVYYVIYPIKPDIDALYYSFLLNIPTIRGVYYSLGKGIYAIERGEGRVNTCRLKVSYDDFGRLNIPIPPIDEQKKITEFIQNKCSEIDALIAIKQAKIEELKEYKKSVIYEYVTGKKDVND